MVANLRFLIELLNCPYEAVIEGKIVQDNIHLRKGYKATYRIS